MHNWWQLAFPLEFSAERRLLKIKGVCLRGSAARGGQGGVAPPGHRAPAASTLSRGALLVRPCSAQEKGPSFSMCPGGATPPWPPPEASVWLARATEWQAAATTSASYGLSPRKTRRAEDAGVYVLPAA